MFAIFLRRTPVPAPSFLSSCDSPCQPMILTLSNIMGPGTWPNSALPIMTAAPPIEITLYTQFPIHLLLEYKNYKPLVINSIFHTLCLPAISTPPMSDDAQNLRHRGTVTLLTEHERPALLATEQHRCNYGKAVP
jgi:hypothetical protein